MAFVNLALKTVNSDGSSAIFGNEGNAIELMASDGLSVYADPLSQANVTPVPVWYAPAYTDQYFQNILNNEQLFDTVAGGIKAFKMYEVSWSNATFQAFASYLVKNNIQLGLEAPPLVASPGQPGYGLEGFAPPNALVPFVSLVQSLGGSLSYIAWDEPWYFGSESTGLFTVAQIATQVAQAASSVEAIFPNIKIGDIEPVGGASSGTAADLQAWFTTYANAAGKPFDFFQADVTTWSAGWESDLAATISTAHANNISVGVIIDGLGAAQNNTAWATQAVSNAQIILSDPSLRPDHLGVQSWQTWPSETPDPTVAGTLASVEADIAAGENAALSVPAVARYDSTGFLQSVTWNGGWEAVRNASTLELLSPTGSVVYQIASNNLENFAFDPNAATVSLTTMTLTSAAGATPVWQANLYTLGLTASGVAFITPSSAASPLTLSLATSSRTGFADTYITDQSMPTLTGVADANAVITVLVDATSFETATASSTGAWSYTFGTALTDGAHDVEAAFTSAKTGAYNHKSYIVTVDTAAPGANVIDISVPNSSVVLTAPSELVGATAVTGTTIIGGAADYTISGLGGGTTINLMDGDQTITLTGQGNNITLGTGNNNIQGGNGGTAAITVAGGNYMINAGGSGDTFHAKAGTGVIQAAGDNANVTVDAGIPGIQISGANDTINLGGSNAYLYSANSATGANISGGSGSCAIWGLGGGTTINLTGGNQTINLTGSGNQISVGSGSNTITAGDGGTASITAAGGQNVIDVGGASDTIHVLAGTGSLSARGDNANVTVDAGTIQVAISGANDTIALGSSTSELVSSNSATGATVTGGAGDHIIWGLGAGTSINLGIGNRTIGLSGAGNEITLGSGSNTIMAASDGTSTITVAGGNNQIIAGGAGDIIHVQGGSGVIQANGDNASVTVDAGTITVLLGGSNAMVFLSQSSSQVVSADAATGATISGGAGNHVIAGLGGGTSVTLGDGNDTIMLSGSGNQITLGTGTSQMSVGNGGNNTISVAGGSNFIKAGGTDDKIHVLAGAGTVIADGASAAVTVDAGTAAVLLNGASSSVVLGSGQNTVVASTQTNNLTAGSGTQTFVVSGTGDTIQMGSGHLTVQDSGSSNSYVLSASSTGLLDLFGGALTNSDMFDLRTLLAGTSWSGNTADLSKVLTVTTTGDGIALNALLTGSTSPHEVMALHGVANTGLTGLLSHSIT